DDDDVMVSTRLNDHLASLKAGQHGTYCGWIDFNADSFEVVGRYPGKEFYFESVLCTGKVLTHGGLMLDRQIFSMYRYEESLAAGIDYGLILLLARNGLALGHTGTYGLLRRLHQSNMTAANRAEPKAEAHRMTTPITNEIGDEAYRGYRTRGASAKELTCSNEERALKELQALKLDSWAGRVAPVFRGEEFGDGSIESVIRHTDELDRLIESHIHRRRTLPIQLRGFSRSAEVYLKLRAVALASRAARPPIRWMQREAVRTD